MMVEVNAPNRKYFIPASDERGLLRRNPARMYRLIESVSTPRKITGGDRMVSKTSCKIARIPAVGSTLTTVFTVVLLGLLQQRKNGRHSGLDDRSQDLRVDADDDERSKQQHERDLVDGGYP